MKFVLVALFAAAAFVGCKKEETPGSTLDNAIKQASTQAETAAKDLDKAAKDAAAQAEKAAAQAEKAAAEASKTEVKIPSLGK